MGVEHVGGPALGDRPLVEGEPRGDGGQYQRRGHRGNEAAQASYALPLPPGLLLLCVEAHPQEPCLRRAEAALLRQVLGGGEPGAPVQQGGILTRPLPGTGREDQLLVLAQGRGVGGDPLPQAGPGAQQRLMADLEMVGVHD